MQEARGNVRGGVPLGGKTRRDVEFEKKNSPRRGDHAPITTESTESEERRLSLRARLFCSTRAASSRFLLERFGTLLALRAVELAPSPISCLAPLQPGQQDKVASHRRAASGSVGSPTDLRVIGTSFLL